MTIMALKISLTPQQSQFFASNFKFNAFVGGFGSGKSHALFSKMLAEKLQYTKLDLGYFAPSYQLIRDIAHIRLQNMLDEASIPYKLNKADNILDLFDKGKILFRSMDVPDRIIGFEIGSAYVDELDTMPYTDAEKAWNKIIARCRQTSKAYKNYVNRINVATTPEGFNFVYNRWVTNANHLYGMVKAPSTSNPHLPEGYIQSLMDTYPEHLVKAYIGGEFVNLTSKQVYPNYDRIRNETNRVINNSEDLHIGADFNVLNTNGIVHVLDVQSRQAFAVAEIIRCRDTPHLIETIKELYSDHRIYVYPDASGNSKKSVDASKTDIKLLKDAGFFVRAPSKNPMIKDRVQSVNGMLRSGNQEIHYWINSKTCPNYSAALEQHSYDTNGMPRKDRSNSIDDINDAAGYCIHYNFPINRRQFSEAHVVSY